MNIVLVLAYAISLSMDAFAVAICRGLTTKSVKVSDSIKVGLFFGIAQGVMPVIGYFLAYGFVDYIEAFDHWIAFALLTVIGGKMIYDTLFGKDDDECCCRNDMSFGRMLLFSVATSIDALAVGIAFSVSGMEILSRGGLLGILASAAVICATTFLLSVLGFLLGKHFGKKFEKSAEVVGGVILILLGANILFEHISGVEIL